MTHAWPPHKLLFQIESISVTISAMDKNNCYLRLQTKTSGKDLILTIAVQCMSMSEYCCKFRLSESRLSLFVVVRSLNMANGVY